MGQPITVLETRSTSNPAVLRFETNRPLSGMGHERYESPPSELRQRPVDELARRLYAAGGVQKIHINGSVVTVTVGGGHDGAGLGDVIRSLFLHYGETPVVPMEAPAAEADTAPESLAEPADAPAAQDAADDAPAPDRPEAETEPAEDQEITGIPETQLDAEVAPPAREPTAADPADIAAAAVEPPAEPANGVAAADDELADVEPSDVEPTADVERPVAEPLVAEPTPADPPDAVEPSATDPAETVTAEAVTPVDTDAAAAPTAVAAPEPAQTTAEPTTAEPTFDAHQPGDEPAGTAPSDGGTVSEAETAGAPADPPERSGT